RRIRSRARSETGSRACEAVARDVRPPSGVRSGRMTLLPGREERYLPSVDRLETAMYAARRAFERGNLDAALQELGLALRLKPERKSTRLNSSHGSISYAVFC